MVEDTVLRMSAFVDCDSQSVVLRVPYDLAVALLEHCPECDDKRELIRRVGITARRSAKFRELLKSHHIEGI